MQIDKLKDLILYQSENTNKSIEVLYDNEDFWLTQKTMGELFNVVENNITYHLQNILHDILIHLYLYSINLHILKMVLIIYEFHQG